jgi:hypothetical protein
VNDIAIILYSIIHLRYFQPRRLNYKCTVFNIVIMRFIQPSYILDTYTNSSTHYCLLKCVYQLVRLSGHVRMCKGYPFYPPLLHCSDLNLFRRCATCFNFTPFFTLFILVEFIHLKIFANSTLYVYAIKYDFICVL